MYRKCSYIFWGHCTYTDTNTHKILGWVLNMQALHLSLAVWWFLILIVVLLRDLLIRFLHFILFQHRAPQLHITALKLIFGQELYNSSSYRISQDVSRCAQSIPVSATESEWMNNPFIYLYISPWDSKISVILDWLAKSFLLSAQLLS